MHLERPEFELDVPDGWREPDESTDETVIYESPSGAERLTISIFHLTDGLQKSEIFDTIKKIVEMRRDSEKEMSEGKTTLSDYQIIDRGGAIFTNFVGYEKPLDRRLSNLVTAENRKLISFYLESAGTNDQLHNSLTKAVFSSIVIK